jgi:tetratricopeptide (TPR) repeat protein
MTLIAALIARLFLAAETGILALAVMTAQALPPSPPGAPPPPPAQRFDFLVRADFFAGVAGDDARLQRAMELCERTLADNPQHAEALVWHGAGILVQGGRAFGKGNFEEGRSLFGRGIKEMNDAVNLAPDNPGVLIPRAATLLEATRAMPAEPGKPLIESAIRNYEHVLEIQAPSWDTLGDHGKGELLFGLAEGYHRIGQHDRARAYFERLIHDAPESGQAPKAREWMASGKVPAASGATACVGCHK